MLLRYLLEELVVFIPTSNWIFCYFLQGLSSITTLLRHCKTVSHYRNYRPPPPPLPTARPKHPHTHAHTPHSPPSSQMVFRQNKFFITALISQVPQTSMKVILPATSITRRFCLQNVVIRWKSVFQVVCAWGGGGGSDNAPKLLAVCNTRLSKSHNIYTLPLQINNIRM